MIRANSQNRVVVAGATSQLGDRIVRALSSRGARVRVIVRPKTSPVARKRLHNIGVEVIEADYRDPTALRDACAGSQCVVSALAGLHEVFLEAQTALLEAAIRAEVPRFIPSDFSGDFTKQPSGQNRNFDLHRSFRERLIQLADGKIASTSILNGMFADLLTGPAPIILFKLKRVLYWEDADQRLDFTTMDDVAAFTAEVARDGKAPPMLRIAGDSRSARELVQIAGEVTGQPFQLLRGGSLDALRVLTRVVRAVYPADQAQYPAWQGMQYLQSMFGGTAKLEPLDNTRYPAIRWTTVRDLLEQARQRARTAA